MKEEKLPEDQVRRWNMISLLLTLPLLLVASYYYGLDVWRNALLAAVLVSLCDAIASRVFLKRWGGEDVHAAVTAIWILLMLPANLSFWYAVLGGVFAVLVVKIPFGGTAHIPFQLAASGMAFLTVCFPAQVFRFTPSVLAPPAHEASLALMLRQGRSVLENQQMNAIVMGQSAGPMGTGGILILAAVLVSLWFIKGRRRSAVAALGMLTAAAFTAFVFPRVMFPVNATLQDTLHLRVSSIGMELCAGSLFFAAVFLLPDPAILPRRWFSALGLGMFTGGLAILLRRFGVYEENVVFALLLSNASVPVFYRFQSEIWHQKSFHLKHKKSKSQAPEALEQDPKKIKSQE